jgi:hypothetical protein
MFEKKKQNMSESTEMMSEWRKNIVESNISKSDVHLNTTIKNILGHYDCKRGHPLTKLSEMIFQRKAQT